jgi:thiol-disulfide isomerase/thioredoxin
MRLFILLSILFLTHVSNAKNNQSSADPLTTVSIHGMVISPAALEAKILLFNDPLQYAESHYYLTVQGDSRFSLDFTLEKPQFAEFLYGDQSLKIWLEPGNSLDISFDGSNFRESLCFEGIGSDANNFLKNFQSAFPDLSQKIEAQMALSEADTYKKYILDVSNQRNAFFLSDTFYHKTSQNFQLLFSKNENYWTGFQLLRYAFDKPLFDGKWEPLLLEDAYYDFLSRMHICTNGLLEYEDYRAFLEKYLEYKKIEPENQPLNNVQLAEKYFKGESLWLFQAKNIIIMARTGKQLENDLAFIAFQKNCTNTSLKNAVSNIINESKGIKKGMKAPSFELHDALGKVVKLEDLRGKTVFMDFWATWCEHCIEEMPNLQNLARQYEGQNIAFVFVSFDKDQVFWKNFVSGMLGTQVWGESISNSMVSKMYGIRALPASFVLDKEGNILKAESGGTSLELTKQIIDTQLGQ